MSAVANSKVYIDKRLEVGLDPNNVPKHIAVIMDGNGRWAQKQGFMQELEVMNWGRSPETDYHCLC